VSPVLLRVELSVRHGADADCHVKMTHFVVGPDDIQDMGPELN